MKLAAASVIAWVVIMYSLTMYDLAKFERLSKACTGKGVVYADHATGECVKVWPDVTARWTP